MGVKGRKTAKGYFEGSKRVAVYALATCQILCYSVYGAAQRQAVSHIPGKGGEAMPITITLHIFGFTVTIRIKGKNRHRAG